MPVHLLLEYGGYYIVFESNFEFNSRFKLQDTEYQQKSMECIRRTYDLLQAKDWKIEKETKRGETISSIYRKDFGKIYKLTCSFHYPAKALCYEIFHKIEEATKWNPAMLESKVLKNINPNIAISYQALSSGTCGLIKNRDFVNLCSWRLLVDGEISEENKNEDLKITSKSHFTQSKLEHHCNYRKNGRIWLNAALSTKCEKLPPDSKYVRAENLITGFAASEVVDHPDICIFEWILCLDLKGVISKCLMDKSYTTFMADYMVNFQKHVGNLRRNNK